MRSLRRSHRSCAPCSFFERLGGAVFGELVQLALCILEYALSDLSFLLFALLDLLEIDSHLLDQLLLSRLHFGAVVCRCCPSLLLLRLLDLLLLELELVLAQLEGLQAFTRGVTQTWARRARVAHRRLPIVGEE